MEVQVNLTKMDLFKFKLSILKMFLFVLVRQLDDLDISRCYTKVGAYKEYRGHGSQGQLDQGGRVQVRAEHCQDVALHPRQIIR